MAPAESHRAALSFPSSNGKTGPIAVSSTSRLTCPSSCPLAGDQGCYAEAGFRTRLYWDRLSRGQVGTSAAAFIRQVMALPAGVMFRHFVAGDQWPDPADPLRIDQPCCSSWPRPHAICGRPGPTPTSRWALRIRPPCGKQPPRVW